MAGPLGTIAPTTDPNWAWDTPAWTSQGNTGDTIGSQFSAPSDPLAPFGAVLSGVIASTQDPTVAATDAFLPATGQWYATLVYVPGPFISTKVYAKASTAGTTSHSYFSLTSVAGVTLASTADGGVTTSTGALSWATAVTLSSGFYYLGMAHVWSVQPKYIGVGALGAATSNATGAVWAAGGPYPRVVTQTAAAVTTTFPASVTPIATSLLGFPYMAMF